MSSLVRTVHCQETSEGKIFFNRYFEILGNAPIVTDFNEITKPKRKQRND